ncbi:5-methylcytosine-specific restriction endonuclease system specificity protein McrC [Paraburkholderia sp. BR14263]|uniref:5-methylcytosine-specific restriction endonuclease system specificity protein McrC n=1 Tax=unclassified Paraburkholderia TaxID=2615204 RepID=UPI0034CD9A02
MEAPLIPIRNVYYMLCYAWNYVRQAELVDLDRLPGEHVLDLLAIVLVQGIEHLARRGLEQGYEHREDEIAGVRGRIDVLRSARRFLPKHGKAACVFDELSVDTLPNRIIKSTLRTLESHPILASELRNRVHRLRRRLPGISEVHVTAQSFRRVQLHANNRYYAFLLSVCRLILSNSFVDSGSGKFRFYDFVRDEKVMSGVFQNFLYHFVRQEISDCQVDRPHIDWMANSETDPTLALLPRMETDITLRRGNKCLIVDAKYYQKTMANRYRSEKFHIENLYQLMSYLTNYKACSDEEVSGMLVYPKVDRGVSERYRIQGFEVSLQTVDMNQPWPQIHNELVSIFS